MAEEGRKRFPTGDCGYDLEIILYSENKGDSESSDLDTQIEGLTFEIYNEAENVTGKNSREILV